jgi:hypothetical protein
MSEERQETNDEGAPADDAGAAAGEGAAASEGAETAQDEAQETAPERVDEDGLPLDRDATIDDVRSKEARHSRFALGCTLVILLLIASFFVLRAGVLG